MNDRTKGVATTGRQSGNAADFVRGVMTEMRRVTWPTREEWISATLLAIGLVVSIGIFTYVADQVFGFLFWKITGH